MSEVTRDTVLEAVEELGNGSVTAISKENGYTAKSVVVQAFLDELVEDGDVMKVNCGAWEGYSIPSLDDENIDSDSYGDESSEDSGGFAEVNSELTQIDNGYEVTKTSTGYDVIFPDEPDTIHQLSLTDRILVINGQSENRWLIRKPEEVFSAINQFSSANNMFHFKVTDASTQAVVDNTLQQISTDSVVIFLKVLAENKAGK